MTARSGEIRRIRRHIANLDNEDQDVSHRAERCLIRYYGARALEELLAVCGHPNPVVRFRAVWALGYSHDPRAYEAILRLTDDPEERVRYDATLALCVLGDMRAVEPLIRLLHLDEATRPAAMARMGAKVVPAIEEVLRVGGPAARLSAVHVLGNFANDYADARSIELLNEARSDPDPAVREDAEFWLKEIGC